MLRVKYSVEQIIHKLREAEVLLEQGQTVKEICHKWNITDPTSSGQNTQQALMKYRETQPPDFQKQT